MAKYVVNLKATKEQLKKNKFEAFGSTTYRLQRFLYKKLILTNIYINIEDRTFETEVLCWPSMTEYYRFNYNINGDNDLVCAKVHQRFDALMEELCSLNILYNKENKNGKQKVFRKTRKKARSSSG